MSTDQKDSTAQLHEEYRALLEHLLQITAVHNNERMLAAAINISRAGLAILAQPQLEVYVTTAPYRAKLLTELGRALLWQASLETGEYASALVTLDEAVAVAETTADPALLADALDELGFAHYQQVMNTNEGEYADALACFHRAATLREALADQRKRCISRFHLGLVAERTGKFVEALALFHEVKGVAEIHGYPIELSDALRHIGFAHQRQGAQAQALAAFEQALAIAQTAGRKAFLPFAHLSVGEIYQEQQQWDTATAHYQSAFQLAQAHQVHRAAVQSLYSLGEVREQCGEPAAAKLYYEQAYALAEQIGFGLGLSMLGPKLAQLGSG